MAGALKWKEALKPYHLKLHFTNRYCYAQVVRKPDGHIVLSASTIEQNLRETLPRTSDKQASSFIGRLLAERAQKLDISAVHWDMKRGQKYHGKIKAFIDSMRAAGVETN